MSNTNPMPGHILENLEKLTPREREIFDLRQRGLTNKQVAEELKIAVKTVKNYISTINLCLEMKLGSLQGIPVIERGSSRQVPEAAPNWGNDYVYVLVPTNEIIEGLRQSVSKLESEVEDLKMQINKWSSH
jgi:DNA-binding CsgD family transcriptional regulator